MRRTRSNAGYRSKFEESIGDSVRARGFEERYEKIKMSYTVPERAATYTPDWDLGNGVIVEAKGRLTAADRKKMLLVKAANPGADIRFVFQRASNPIRKGSKTTYAAWCDQHGFPWAEGNIPTSWLKESKKNRR